MKPYRLIPLLLLFVLAGCRSSVLDDPSVTYRYYVPQTSHVKLTVTNNYHTVVATLVDKNQTAGTYSANVNASGWQEGVYYTTLECTGIGSTYYYKRTNYFLIIK